MGLLQLGPMERLVDAQRLALSAMDRVVGRLRVPCVRLAWLDRRALGHRRPLDDVVRMHGEHDRYERLDDDGRRRRVHDYRVWSAGCSC